MQQGQSDEATGTRDETYDVISIVYHALQGAENCEIYAEDAERDELRQFFERAGEQQRQLAEEGKKMLAQCLQKEGGGSAFSFGEGQQSGQSSQSSSSQSETVTSGGRQTDTGIG